MLNPRQHISLLATVAASLLFMTAGLMAQLEPTPRLGQGPFYPPDDSQNMDNDLTAVDGENGTPEGQRIYIVGTVKNTAGEPLEGAKLVIWQTDQVGKYNHPRENRYTRDGQPLPVDPNFQYWGKTTTDMDGKYQFKTIVPGHYGGRANHIHYKISHPEYRDIATELHFRGDPKLKGDFVTADLSEDEHDVLAVDLEEPGEGFDAGAKVATFDIVLEK